MQKETRILAVHLSDVLGWRLLCHLAGTVASILLSNGHSPMEVEDFSSSLASKSLRLSSLALDNRPRRRVGEWVARWICASRNGPCVAILCI